MADEIPRPDGPDVDIGGAFLKVSWTLYAFSTIVLAGRLYAQKFITRQLGLGDWLMVGAWFFGVLSCALMNVAYNYGFGRHFFFLTPHERIMSQKYTFINEPIGIASSALGRLSFMVLLYKLFGTTKTRRWFIIFLAGQTIVINLFTAITIFTQCPHDVDSLWDKIGHPSECWSPDVQTYTGLFQGSCNAATDLVLTILPAIMFWDLKMDLKTKLGLIALLSLSVFAFVSSVIKVVLLPSLGERQDYTFNTVSFFTWINVENTLVIIAASVPMLRPIFAKKKPDTSTNSYHMGAYGSKSRGRAGSGNIYALSSTDRGNTGFKRSGATASDGDSIENILPVQGKADQAGAIVRTTDISMEYDAYSERKVNKVTTTTWERK